MQVNEEFKTYTNALYKKLYETIRDATPEDMPNGLEVALTALNSLATTLHESRFLRMSRLYLINIQP